MSIKPAPLATWLADPLASDVAKSVDRLRTSGDVQQVALMPDVHLAKDVCIGAVVATTQLIYPAAVGNDIGCGMLSIAFDADANLLNSERSAAQVLAGLYELAPCNKHPKPRELPACLTRLDLSDQRLKKLAGRDGRVQLGTLGRGNHFLEFQADEQGRLWVMIHSGSRAIGQAIADHHLMNARPAESGLKYLDSNADVGRLYLSDVHWARMYAAQNRLAMLAAVSELMQKRFAITSDANTLIHSDHNHVQQELHAGKSLWIHRKGAQSAALDEPGIIPGSMGTANFHTAGRGCENALLSSSHGAGRALTRTDARRKVTGKDFVRQVGNLWYDHRIANKLRDEAPVAYKDIRRVMKAQHNLTRIVRELRPLLSYKGV
jgi:tRNA-splicing ligase RtcB